MNKNETVGREIGTSFVVGLLTNLTVSSSTIGETMDDGDRFRRTIQGIFNYYEYFFPII